MKRTAALVGLAFSASLLTGCGGDDAAAYCDDLESAKTNIDALGEGNVEDFQATLDAIHQLAEEAPEEIADQWATLDDEVTKVEAALEDAGIEPGDLQGMVEGEVPEGADLEKLQALGQTMQDLGGEEVEAASEDITEHADTECDVQLNE